MIPLAIPQMAGNEGKYLQQCVDTNFVSSVGPFVTRFEHDVARAAGCTHAVATSAGTTGLHAALVALGVKRDDLVILPSLTFIASANAIAACGAQPWLLDVSLESWTLCPRALEQALVEATTRDDNGITVHKASGRRVAAVMPVYTLGLPADMDAIAVLARKHGLKTVCDAAAALGATYKSRPSGDLGADLTVYSFNGNKTVTAGGGGAVTGNDEELCDLVRHLTTTARRGADYNHDRIGFNYRMTNLQAAVGCAQLESLDRFVAAKRSIAKRYNDELAGVGGAALFPSPTWAESACWFSGVTTRSPTVIDLIPQLRDRGVDSRPFWKPIHLQIPYADCPRQSLTVSDTIWDTVLTLPCSTSLSPEEQSTVISAVKECLNG